MHDFFVNPRYIDLGSLAAQTMDLLIIIYCFFFGWELLYTFYLLKKKKLCTFWNITKKLLTY